MCKRGRVREGCGMITSFTFLIFTFAVFVLETCYFALRLNVGLCRDVLELSVLSIDGGMCLFEDGIN